MRFEGLGPEPDTFRLYTYTLSVCVDFLPVFWFYWLLLNEYHWLIPDGDMSILLISVVQQRVRSRIKLVPYLAADRLAYHWATPHTFLAMPRATPCFLISDFITFYLYETLFFFCFLLQYLKWRHSCHDYRFLWLLLDHFYDFFSSDQVIKMLDDHGVSSDGIAVYEVAYQVRRSISDNSLIITGCHIYNLSFHLVRICKTIPSYLQIKQKCCTARNIFVGA
jgi:hypothetical protein